MQFQGNAFADPEWRVGGGRSGYNVHSASQTYYNKNCIFTWTRRIPLSFKCGFLWQSQIKCIELFCAIKLPDLQRTLNSPRLAILCAIPVRFSSPLINPNTVTWPLFTRKRRNWRRKMWKLIENRSDRIRSLIGRSPRIIRSTDLFQWSD